MWTFQNKQDMNFDETFKQKTFQLMSKGFEKDDIPQAYFERWYAATLSHSNVIGHLPEIAGLCFLDFSSEPYDAGYLMWVNGICVMPGEATRGAGYQALVEGMRHFGEPVSLIGGRTQSPYFVKLIQKFGPTWPVDISYETDEGEGLCTFMAAHARQLEGLNEMQRHNGVIKGIYDMPMYPKNCENLYFVPDYDPAQGDVVICVSMVQSANG